MQVEKCMCRIFAQELLNTLNHFLQLKTISKNIKFIFCKFKNKCVWFLLKNFVSFFLFCYWLFGWGQFQNQQFWNLYFLDYSFAQICISFEEKKLVLEVNFRRINQESSLFSKNWWSFSTSVQLTLRNFNVFISDYYYIILINKFY